MTEFVGWILFGAGAAVWLVVSALIDAWRARQFGEDPSSAGVS